MKIVLSPQVRVPPLTLFKEGDALTVNGEVFDFTPMGDGDTLPLGSIASEWFVGDVDKVGTEVIITLLFPNPWNYSPEQAFPEPLLNVPDGPVALPQPLPLEVPNE